MIAVVFMYEHCSAGEGAFCEIEECHGGGVALQSRSADRRFTKGICEWWVMAFHSIMEESVLRDIVCPNCPFLCCINLQGLRSQWSGVILF